MNDRASDNWRFLAVTEENVEDGATAALGAMTGEIPAYEIDPKTGEAHTSEEMVERAQDVSALAGPGALGASEGELTSATLGVTPMLRPAVKYNGRIYKALTESAPLLIRNRYWVLVV